jgi:hypothetical protein
LKTGFLNALINKIKGNKRNLIAQNAILFSVLIIIVSIFDINLERKRKYNINPNEIPANSKGRIIPLLICSKICKVTKLDSNQKRKSIMCNNIFFISKNLRYMRKMSKIRQFIQPHKMHEINIKIWLLEVTTII